MSRSPKSTTLIRRGSVVTKVYRIARSDGRQVFKAVWTVGGVRSMRTFPSFAAAHAEASLKADQLSAGKLGTIDLSADDGATLDAARKLCGKIPLMAALQEWSAARKLCQGPILPAVEDWAARRAGSVRPIEAQEAVDAFIKAKGSAKKDAERTYRAKLKPFSTHFAGRNLDSIGTAELAAYLERWSDGVTRNDIRKRTVALFNWARGVGHLPSGVATAIEGTERANENPAEIGTITPALFRSLLEWVRAEHPEYLAALVLAGFCAVRADEVHGKRSDRSRRQVWEDIDLAGPHLNVSVAKRNTPSWRLVEIPAAAVEWLLLCNDRTGPVCESGALEKLRLIIRHAVKPDGTPRFQPIPPNAWRHSAISYRVALTGDKAATATWAGNSVAEIDRRYRRPMTRAAAEEWFGIRPGAATEEVLLA